MRDLTSRSIALNSIGLIPRSNWGLAMVHPEHLSQSLKRKIDLERRPGIKVRINKHKPYLHRLAGGHQCKRFYRCGHSPSFVSEIFSWKPQTSTNLPSELGQLAVGDYCCSGPAATRQLLQNPEPPGR